MIGTGSSKKYWSSINHYKAVFLISTLAIILATIHLAIVFKHNYTTIHNYVYIDIPHTFFILIYIIFALSLICGIRMQKYGFGLLLITFMFFTLTILPVVKYKYPSGTQDVPFHMGYIKDIIGSGKLLGEVAYYPLYALSTTLVLITPLDTVLYTYNFILIFINSLIILTFFIFSYSLFKDKKIAFYSAILLAISDYYILYQSIAESEQLAIVYLFFVLYFLVKIMYSNKTNLEYLILFIIFSISLIVMHRLPSAILLSLFPIFIVIRLYLYKHKMSISENKFVPKQVWVLKVYLLLVVIYFAWYMYQGYLRQNILMFLNFIPHSELRRLAPASKSFYTFIEGNIFRITIAMLGIYGILKLYIENYRRCYKRGIAITIFLNFTLIAIYYVLFRFVTPEGFDAERMVIYGYYPLILGSAYCMSRLSKKKGIVLILTILFIFGVFNAYPRPFLTEEPVVVYTVYNTKDVTGSMWMGYGIPLDSAILISDETEAAICYYIFGEKNEKILPRFSKNTAKFVKIVESNDLNKLQDKEFIVLSRRMHYRYHPIYHHQYDLIKISKDLYYLANIRLNKIYSNGYLFIYGGESQ